MIDRLALKYPLMLLGILGLVVLSGCGDNKYQRAYETAKTLSSDGSLSDTEAVKYLESSEDVLQQLAGIKIKAQNRHLYVLEKLLERYENLKMWPKAIETADKLIDLQPTTIDWYIRKGRAHVRLSKVDESHYEPAERAFRAALELDSDSLRAHYGLGLLYGFHMDKIPRARRHLRQAAYETTITVKNRPEVVDARFALGKLEFQSERFDQAREAFDSILKLESISSESRFLAQKNLGDVARRTGSTELAKQHYHKAYDINPVDSSIRQRLRSLGVEIDDRFERFDRD